MTFGRAAHVSALPAVLIIMNTHERNAEWAADRDSLTALQTAALTAEDRAVYADLNRNADGTEGRTN